MLLLSLEMWISDRYSYCLQCFCLCVLCIHLKQRQEPVYDNGHFFNVCVLQQLWATISWRTRCYRLARVLLLTTLCWRRASPRPHLVSSTLLVSFSWTRQSVCAVLSACVCVCIYMCSVSCLIVCCSVSSLTWYTHSLLCLSVCMCACVSLFFSEYVAVRWIH